MGKSDKLLETGVDVRRGSTLNEFPLSSFHYVRSDETQGSPAHKDPPIIPTEATFSVGSSLTLLSLPGTEETVPVPFPTVSFLRRQLSRI